jgi:hypothetical protein
LLVATRAFEGRSHEGRSARTEEAVRL